jgi:hypothetical protein
MELTISKEKIETLQNIGAGKIINNSLNKIIKNQINKYLLMISQVNAEMIKFETDYRMTSSDFFQKFENGQLDDKADFMEWAGLYENILLFNDRIKMLELALKL